VGSLTVWTASWRGPALRALALVRSAARRLQRWPKVESPPAAGSGRCVLSGARDRFVPLVLPTVTPDFDTISLL
jgi:hypothetical protein